MNTPLKTHLMEKKDYIGKLNAELNQARENLANKKRLATIAKEAYANEKSAIHQKIGTPILHDGARDRSRASSNRLDIETLDALERQAKQASEAHQKAKAEYEAIEKKVVMARPSLSAAYTGFSIAESRAILRDTLSKTALFDTLQESLTLLREGNPELGRDQLQKLFFNTLFDALLVDDAIPQLDNALAAINERLN